MNLPSIETNYEHITLNEEGTPLITGTTMKVVELVLGKVSYGWSPEELHFQHSYLTMGQIHSALAYYWDHQEDMEEDINRRLQKVQRLQLGAEPSRMAARLKAKGLL